MKKVFILLLLVGFSFSKELETCYRILFWFLPVAESCVSYSLDSKELRIKSWAKTVAAGSLVKRINSWGEATLVGLSPKSFALFQREGSFIRDHFYFFTKEGVSYRIIRYRGAREEVKEGLFKSSVLLLDPFSATLAVYIDTPNYRDSVVHVFYDMKVQTIHYRTISEEEVVVLGSKYNTWKVLLIPKFDTKGLLKPKGKWFVWIDKETNLPVKLKVSFTIGSASIYLEKIKGYKKLIKEAKGEQVRVLQGSFR